MDQRIPPLLHPLLQQYGRLLDQHMYGRMAAFYLEGSIALGEFNPRLSDIDFIAVLKGQALPADFEKILNIHRRIEHTFHAWKMSGMYVQLQDLGRLDHTDQPFLSYHERHLMWSNHFELSSVTWWILKNHGVALFGQSPHSLNITIDMDHLIEVQYRNLNTYWAGWAMHPGRILALASDWGVQWTVLGVLRQFYTIHERQITSKVKAGEYALDRLPECWHPIIREALLLRGAILQSSYPSRIRRALDTYHFLKYVITTCNDGPLAYN